MAFRAYSLLLETCAWLNFHRLYLIWSEKSLLFFAFVKHVMSSSAVSRPWIFILFHSFQTYITVRLCTYAEFIPDRVTLKGVVPALVLTVPWTSGFEVCLLSETVTGSSCKAKFWLQVNISPILHVPVQFLLHLTSSKKNILYWKLIPDWDSGGWKAGNELSTCPCSPKSCWAGEGSWQCSSALLWWDSSCCTASSLAFPEQEGYGPVRMSPKEDHQDDQKTEATLLWRRLR